MSLLSLFSGLGLSSQDEQDEQARLDAALAAENQKDAAKYGPEWYAAVERNRLAGVQPDIETQLGDEFQAGAIEGLEKMQTGVKKTLGETLKGALGFVPWWAWIGLAAVAAHHLGLFALVKRKIAKA